MMYIMTTMDRVFTAPVNPSKFRETFKGLSIFTAKKRYKLGEKLYKQLINRYNGV